MLTLSLVLLEPTQLEELLISMNACNALLDHTVLYSELVTPK
jgi:hypothetical protein